MEGYKMSDIWELKLRELRLQEFEMKKSKNFTEEDLHDLNVIIEYVKKEYAKALMEEKITEKDGAQRA